MNEERTISCTNFECEYRRESNNIACSGLIKYNCSPDTEVYSADSHRWINCYVVESLNLALSNRNISEAIAKKLGVELQ